MATYSFDIKSDRLYKPLARRRSRRGMAFIATMLVLFLIMASILIGIANSQSGNLGGGLVGTVNNGIQATSARMGSASAFDLSESGLEYTIEWLSEQSAPPDPFNGKSFCPWNTNSSWSALPNATSNTSRATVNFGTGSFSVMVYPNSANYSDQSSDMSYLIESKGVSNGATVVLDAFVQQTNFGHYAYFTDYDPTDGWWVVGLNSFNGPMHSNDKNGTTPTNILWYNNQTTNPMFTYLGSDAYTVSASSINWNQNTIGTVGSPTTTANWSNVAAGGANTVHTGAPLIPLPTSSNLQLNAALSGTTPPSSIGAVVPSKSGNTTGGVYINGNVNSMALSVTGGTTQVITINQTDTSQPSGYQNVVTTVTINQSTDTTSISTVDGPGGTGHQSSSSYTGITNGVVYCNGNIGTNTNSTSASGGLSGTIADNYTNSSGVTNYWGMTIATATNDNTNIDGSIQYNTSTSNSSFAANAGTFGLLSNVIDVTQKDANNNNLSNVVVDGAVMAFGSSNDSSTFQAANYGENFTGSFTLYGSYIAQQAGCFGEVNLSGQLQCGLAEHYLYDSRLGNRPPPFFPTTGNTYTVISWKQVNALIQ